MRRQDSPTPSTSSSTKTKTNILVTKFQKLFDSFISNNSTYAIYESMFDVIWAKCCKEYSIVPNSKVPGKQETYIAMIEKVFKNNGELLKLFIQKHINNIPNTNMNLQNIMMNQQTHAVPLQNLSSILSSPSSNTQPTNSTSTPTTNTQDPKPENKPNFTSEAEGLKHLQSLIEKCSISLNIESLLAFTLECERIKSEAEKTLKIYTTLVTESKKLQPFLENKISDELDKKENPDTILKSIYATLGNSHTKSTREKRLEKRTFEEIQDNILYEDPFQQSTKGEYENEMQNFLQDTPNYGHKVDISLLSKTNSTQSLSNRNNDKRDEQSSQIELQQPAHTSDNVSTSSKTLSHHSNPSSKPITSQKTTPNRIYVSDISEMSQSSSMMSTPMQKSVIESGILLQRIQSPISIQTQQFPQTNNSQFNYQTPIRTVQLNTQPPGNFVQIQNQSFPLQQFPVASYYPANNQSNQYTTYNSNNQ